MKYTFTKYQHKRDTHGEPLTLSWDEWVEKYFSKHELRGTPDLVDPTRNCGHDHPAWDAPAALKCAKAILDEAKDGPALVFAKIAKGQSHKKENVEEIHAIAFDLDGRTDEETTAALLALSDFTYAAATTYKHGTRIAEGKARLRVIVPLDKPLPPAGYKDVWLRANQLIGGINDPATKDANRLSFLPATFDHQYAEAWSNPGRSFLSVDDLPVLTKGKALPKASAGTGSISNDDGDIIQRIRRRALCTSPKVEGEELAGALKALLRSDSLAGEGKRHQTIRDVTWWLSKKERTLSDALLEILFRPSLDVMESEDPSWDGMAEVLKLYNDACEKRAANATGNDPEFTPYQPEDLERIAFIQRTTVAELSRRWVIQHGNAYFFLQGDGYYSKPANGPFEGRTKAKQTLKRAPVILDEPSQNGVRKRTIGDIVEDYGWVADNLLVDLTAHGSYYDASEKTIHEATCPPRWIEPEYNPEIAEWFRLLAGEEHHERFLDWLAVCPNLERPIAGLYIKGVKGAGKSLLCNGLARFWTKGAYTGLSAVFANFNERVAACPLVVADEQMPSARRGEDPTAILRQYIGNSEHELNRKYRATTAMHGALRVVLTANNAELLRGNINGPEDQEAMTERWVIIEATTAASNYLAALGGVDYIDQRWRAQDGIAKHVMHLACTRTVKPGGRFAVAGKETETHRHVFTSQYGQLVREWLVKFCDSPNTIEQMPMLRKLVRAGNGHFYVNSEALKLGWQTYLGLNVRDEPRISLIGRALAVMAPTGSSGRVQRAVGTKRLWFYEIDPMHLVEFSKEHMIGSEDSIISTVDRPLAEAS